MMLWLLGVSLASEPVDLDEPSRTASGTGKPSVSYEVSFRSRYVSVPRGFMDLWFTDADTEGWPIADADRPHGHGATFGVEFAMHRKQTLGIFYLEYAKSLMGEGFWDDTDNPNTFIDGEWLRPGKAFGAMILGANGAYDAPIVEFDQTNDKFALSFEVGGGLGIAFVTGRAEKWEVDRADGTPAWVRVANGAPADGYKDLKSPVWPVPDFSLAFKLNFIDHVVLRFEGGLHGGLFYGGSLGGRF